MHGPNLFDVVVAGGGPSGFGAAMGAASQGASVVLIERYPALGGMGTIGLVNNFCAAHHDGQRFIIGGAFGLLRERLIARKAIFSNKQMEAFDPEVYAQEMHELCANAGVHIMLNSKIEGISFEPHGAQLRLNESREIRGSAVVDCSGDASIAAQAGVLFNFGRPGDHAVMPLTLCYILGPVDLEKAFQARPDFHHIDPVTGQSYFWLTGCLHDEITEARSAGELTIQRDHVSCVMSVPGNRDFVSVNFGRVFVKDPTDPAQLAEAECIGRQQAAEGLAFFKKYLPGFERAQITEFARQIGVRETRQIEGLYTLTADDILECRQFEDVIAQCRYPIDIHDPSSDKTTMKSLPFGAHYDIPLRCLIPRQGPENLVFGGRCISATHEAMSSFRVAPSVMALGEASGVTAALAARDGVGVSQVNPKTIQKCLVQVGGILE